MDPSDQVLWTLDNSIQPFDFERLCADLLCRYGYRHIVPVGGMHDKGRDAEARYWKGEASGFSRIVFQFSLQKSWESKLRNDAKKIAKNAEGVSKLVFVTSQDVTGAKQDLLRKQFKTSFNWDLAIYSREWLRNKLTQFDQDLAKTYLGLDLPPTIGQSITQIDLEIMDGDNYEEMFPHSSPELARALIVEGTRQEPDIASNWYRLAKVDFFLRNYSSALEAVSNALQRTDAEDQLSVLNMTNFKGAILAEFGIQKKSRPLLIQAKEIFSEAADRIKRPQDYFNLANVLDALEEYEQAETAYHSALKLKPDYAQAWKNLGSLYSKENNQEKALECFQKALEHNPEMVEGHLSMANLFLIFFNAPDKAVSSFERAFAISKDADRRWDYVRYWYGKSLYTLGRHREALAETEKELIRRPDDLFLLNQKAQILTHLRKENHAFEEQALKFLQFRAQALPKDFAGLNELIEIFDERGTPDKAWPWIDSNLKCPILPLSELAARAELSSVQLRSGFLNFRRYYEYRKRYPLAESLSLLRGKGLTPDDRILSVLEFGLMAPFGFVGERLREAEESVGRKSVEALFEEALSLTARIFTSIGSPWLAKNRPNLRDKQIEFLTLGTLHIPDLVITELSRQMGFLVGKFGLSKDAVPDGKNVDWDTIMSDATTRFLTQTILDWDLGPSALSQSHD